MRKAAISWSTTGPGWADPALRLFSRLWGAALIAPRGSLQGTKRWQRCKSFSPLRFNWGPSIRTLSSVENQALLSLFQSGSTGFAADSNLNFFMPSNVAIAILPANSTPKFPSQPWIRTSLAAVPTTTYSLMTSSQWKKRQLSCPKRSPSTMLPLNQVRHLSRHLNQRLSRNSPSLQHQLARRGDR